MLYCSNPIFFVSDLHFFHDNIIKFCSRPFKNSIEMNEVLIENWNKTVPNNGIVFHLGDFGFAPPNFIQKTLARLNGTIHFIKGNHDRHLINSGTKASDYCNLQISDPQANKGINTFILFHYPILVWDKEMHGSIHLFGHCHGTMNLVIKTHFPKHKMLDVGVDSICNIFAEKENRPVGPNDYKPISYAEVIDYMSKKNTN